MPASFSAFSNPSKSQSNPSSGGALLTLTSGPTSRGFESGGTPMPKPKPIGAFFPLPNAEVPIGEIASGWKLPALEELAAPLPLAPSMREDEDADPTPDGIAPGLGE